MRRLPWTLYRYLGREVGLTFLMSLAFLSFLFALASCIQAVHLNFDLRIVLPWVIDSTAYFLFFTVPASLLFASTLTYGRFAADKEFTATAASGISPLHVFAPMGAIALVLTLVALATQGTVLPDAYFKKRDLARYVVPQLENLGEGYHREIPIPGGRVYCASYRGSKMYGVHIDYVQEKKRTNAAGAGQVDKTPIKLLAQSADIDVDVERDLIRFLLSGASALFPDPDVPRIPMGNDEYLPQGWQSVQFGEQIIEIPMPHGNRTVAARRSAQLSQERVAHVAALAQCEATLATGAAVSEQDKADTVAIQANARKQIRKIDSETWKRRALALACFTFPFLGFPLSLSFPRSHRLTPFFVGVVFVVAFFYPLLILGETLVEWGAAPAPIALLSGNALLFAVAAFLSGRLLYR